MQDSARSHEAIFCIWTDEAASTERTVCLCETGPTAAKKNVEFVVIGRDNPSLQGSVTAKKLQLFKIRMSVNIVSSIPDHIQKKFGIFQGVGTLKDIQVKLHVDPNIEPTAQLLRGTPYQLQSRVEEHMSAFEIFCLAIPTSHYAPVFQCILHSPQSESCCVT